MTQGYLKLIHRQRRSTLDYPHSTFNISAPFIYIDPPAFPDTLLLLV